MQKKVTLILNILVLCITFFSGTALAITGITSDLVPTRYMDDGVPVLELNYGERFSFTLTAQEPIGEIRWTLPYIDLDNPAAILTDGSDIVLSKNTGNSVTVSGTLSSNKGYSALAFANDDSAVGLWETPTVLSYDFIIAPSSLSKLSQDTPAKLELAAVSPVILSDEVIARLAQNISVDPSELILLTSADFDPSEPPEPTNAMRQKVQGQFMAKLNTINVSKDGWYVFMVTVSDDLVGTKVGDLRLYGAEASDFTASSFNAAFGLMPIVNGITGGLEISNFFGVKLDTLPKQFLATMFLSASQSLTVYIVKILLLLLGGCDAGFGVIGGGLMMIVGGIFAVRFIKRKRR